MSNIIVDFLGLSAILSSILVITSKNPVISVLFLISVFMNVSGYLVIQGIGFLGISYLIVYIGAVTVLFLFVIMILNLQLTELTAVGKEYTKNLPLGAMIGSGFIYELIVIMGFTGTENNEALSIKGGINIIPEGISIIPQGIINWFNTVFLNIEWEGGETKNNVHYIFNTNEVDTQFGNLIQIESIGYNIYTTGGISLIIISMILLLAIVGPITLSMDKTGEGEGGLDYERIKRWRIRGN